MQRELVVYENMTLNASDAIDRHAQVLRVRSCLAGSHARSVLQDGDFLLTVAGRPVSHFQAVEAALACSAGAQAAPSLKAPTACSGLPGVTSSGDLGEAASEVSIPRSE